MILSALLLTMAADIPAAAPRQQFSTCLRRFMVAKAEEGMEREAFGTAINTACAEQETAYRTAYIAAATRQGDSRAAATRDATLEIDDLRANFRDQYRMADAE